MQISEIESRVITGNGSSPYHASLRNLSAPFGLTSLLVHEEILNPGASNSRPHFHTRKEEMIVVLEGSLRVTTVTGSALVVLYSSELESAQPRVEAAGGEIVKPIFSFPGGRRFHFKHPSGNEYAVWSE